MRRKLIVGNWKMNMIRGEARTLAKQIVELLPSAPNVDVVLAPPFTSLDVVGQVISETFIELGAQNVFWEASGAFTGEISPIMLADVGCKWVIIGHSERRHILGETDSMLNKKIKKSLEDGLAPIFCVGENMVERNEGQTARVIEKQIEGGLRGLRSVDPEGFAVAYEPVWAIGTGNNATPEQIEEVHGLLRGLTGSILGTVAESLRILYGGSVNSENAIGILSTPNVDGSLVGGASLQARSFARIVQIAGG